MKVLVIGSHPDDEILGVGGTILKHISKGDSVYVCIATRGYEPEWSKKCIKRKIIEQAKVDQLIGIKKKELI